MSVSVAGVVLFLHMHVKPPHQQMKLHVQIIWTIQLTRRVYGGIGTGSDTSDGNDGNEGKMYCRNDDKNDDKNGDKNGDNNGNTNGDKNGDNGNNGNNDNVK